MLLFTFPASIAAVVLLLAGREAADYKADSARRVCRRVAEAAFQGLPPGTPGRWLLSSWRATAAGKAPETVAANQQSRCSHRQWAGCPAVAPPCTKPSRMGGY